MHFLIMNVERLFDWVLSIGVLSIAREAQGDGLIMFSV